MGRIKPCKYCGKTPKIFSYGIRKDNEYWIRCENDVCMKRPFTSSYDTESEVIEIWNRRMEGE